MTNTVARLVEAGFEHIGYWKSDRDVEVRFDDEVPADAGVYAIAVGDEVRYIGAAQRGLRKRFAKYKYPRTTGSVAVRLRRCIKEALQGSRVSVLAFIPREPSFECRAGLPINVVAGLEEGLIRDLRPAWNRRGLQFEELKEEAEEEAHQKRRTGDHGIAR
jgi:hypothetical protein